MQLIQLRDARRILIADALAMYVVMLDAIADKIPDEAKALKIVHEAEDLRELRDLFDEAAEVHVWRP